MRAAAPLILRQGGGTIVNFTSKRWHTGAGMSRQHPPPKQDRVASASARGKSRVGLVLLLVGLSVLVAVLADSALRRVASGPSAEAPAAGAAPAASAQAPPRAVPPTATSTRQAGAPPALFQRSTWGEFSLGETALSPEGGFVVSGSFTETLLFAPGTPEATLKKVAREGGTSGFVASFSAQRRLRWVRLLPDTKGATQLRVLPGGSVVITCIASPRTQIEAGADTLYEIPDVQSDEHPGQVHVIRWDGAGALTWVRSFAGPKEASDHGVEVLPDGSVLAWNHMWRRQRVYPLEHGGLLETPPNFSASTAMILIAPDGTKRWMRMLDPQRALVTRASTRLPDGTVVLSGNLDGSLRPGANDPDRVFLSWIRPEDGETERITFGYSTEQPRPLGSGGMVYRETQVHPKRLAALPDGSIALAVAFAGVFVADERLPDFSTLQAGSPRDMALVLFSRSGALRWARIIGGENANLFLYDHLQADAEGVHLYGRVSEPVTFSRGKADARTFTAELGAPPPRNSFRASFGRDGELLALESSAGPPPLPLEEDCCQRTSWLLLREERPLPAWNPPHAPELQAWLDQVLGKVELGWTPEDQLKEALGPGAILKPGEIDETQPYPTNWQLSWLRLPGGESPLPRGLQAERGVAMFLVLRPIPTGNVFPYREDVRRAFAPLSRKEVKEGRIDEYCHLPGRPGVVMHVHYIADGRLAEILLGGVERMRCSSAE